MSSSALVSPKTSRPHVRQPPVRRQRLHDLLDAAEDRAVTLVCAGAGWGKTTLVSEWAENQGRPVAWLTVDTFDNDPQLFWSQVVAALRAAGAVPAGVVPADFDPIPERAVDRIRITARVLAALQPSSVLVLDDFQEITDRALVRELAAVLQSPRSGFRVVLITRSEPPPPLHRLRAAGELVEIREPALGFTADETADLLAGDGLHISGEDLAALVDRTEGWAVALRLAAGFLADSRDGRTIADFAGDVVGVADYLTDEVLRGQPSPIRRFLLYTSICESVCGELTDAITLDPSGQKTLEELERVNHFVVRLGPKPQWFRYHHLVRDALRHRLLVETPSVVPQLHQRAAGWYAEHDAILEAVWHAARARDWAYVGRLTARAAPLMVSAHRAALTKILSQVPSDAFASTAELMVSAALLLFQAGDYDAIPDRLAGAMELLEGRPDDDRIPLEITIRALQISVNSVKGDMPALVTDSTALLAVLARARTAEVTHALQYRAIALNNKGVGLLWTGHTDAAERYLWVAATAARSAGLELVEINAFGHLAMLELMFGSVREAASLADNALVLAERHGWRDALQTVPAHLAAANVELERADVTKAQRATRRGLRAHRGDPEAVQWKLWLGTQARCALMQGDTATAQAHLHEARIHQRSRLTAPAVDRWLSLIESETDLAAGRPELVVRRYSSAVRDRTLAFAERVYLARAAFAQRNVRRAETLLVRPGSVMADVVATVQAQILGALIADARGHGIRSADMLADAIALAAREGIRQPFVCMASGRLDALLARHRTLTTENADFVADVGRLMRAGRRDARPALHTGELSERETEVLHYLPTMLTAGDIAGELNVSVNTIKAHMRSIYRKLDAARRREAVARARDQGLL
jgi:LuxR family transcriptional regulator, maltose regulon positive regulatory protein